MAMDYDVQRLELGDVVLIDLDDQAGQVEAEMVRDIAPTRPCASRCESMGARTSSGNGVSANG